MLTVQPPEQALKLLFGTFGGRRTNSECVPLQAALFRVLAADVTANAPVPGFCRATVDGYAVRAADTFGCSSALPALLKETGAVSMGALPETALAQGCCMAVPTGGALPKGADAMVMLEDTEPFSKGTIAVEKPAAPGQHLIFPGDDIAEGALLLPAGTRLSPAHIGALAALGLSEVLVARRPVAAILSTGDELLRTDRARYAVNAPPGMVYDVNGPLLAAAVRATGAEPRLLPVCPDDEGALQTAVSNALEDADLLLLSGGSSVGQKDMTARVLGRLGTVLLHGLALKPGKPTLFAAVSEKPVLGLPGHPVAAQTVFHLFGRPLLYAMQGAAAPERTAAARLCCAVSSNHGREECMPVRLTGGDAVPVIGKSGLITKLCGADGFIRIPRDAEGLPAGAEVTVYLYD